MIKRLVVINYLDDVLEIDLADPEKSGFAITDIKGLSQDNSDVNVSEFQTIDGGKINNVRANTRNIVLSIVYYGDDIEAVRHRSYHYFQVRKPITLMIDTDHRGLYINGIVESNDAIIFGKTAGCEISILCPDPFFYDSVEGGAQHTEFSVNNSVFEFPFSDDKPIEFSIIEHNSTKTIYYDGDEDIGISVQMHFLGTATEIKIYNTSTNQMMTFDTSKIEKVVGHPIAAGDDLLVTTEKGNKSVYYVSDNVYYNVLNCVTRDSDWIILQPGDNDMAYTAKSGELNIDISINNRTKYDGV